MGLSGRREKQRIPNDPRNLGWSDDAARFGSAYLSKFGWDSSKGLGEEGDGMKSHLKVAHKLDMLGIGAAHTKDPNGIAWKQNRDFERLLERLNGGTGEEGGNGTKVDGFARANEEAEAEGVEEKKEEGTRNEKAEKRARKEAKREKRKLKEEGKEEKKSKKRKMEVMVEESVVEEVIIAPVASTSKVPPRGHRAKFIRSKRMALTDATAMAEVLGISSSSAQAPTSSAPASSHVVDLELEKITTSSKSVMDYFKEKLLAKTNPTSSVSSTFYADVDEDDTPVRQGLGSSRAQITLDSMDEDNPSRGLGLGFAPSSSMALLAIQPAAIPAAVTEEGGSAMKHKKSKKAKKDVESQPSSGDPAMNDLVDHRQATPIIGPPDADDEDARRVTKLARKEARRMAKLAVPTSTP